MKLTIKLIVDGKEKEFESKFISARMLKESNKIARRHIFLQVEEDEKEIPVFEDMIEVFANYMTEVYSNQFTSDQILDGMDCEEFQKVVYETVLKIMGKSEVSSEKSK